MTVAKWWYHQSASGQSARRSLWLSSSWPSRCTSQQRISVVTLGMWKGGGVQICQQGGENFSLMPMSPILFPQCIARVPVSLWGWGGSGVFAPCWVWFATVGNRLFEVAKPLPLESLGRCHFWHVQRVANLISRDRRGTLSTLSVTQEVSQVSLCDRRIL